MFKNLVLVLAVLAVLAEGAYIVKLRDERSKARTPIAMTNRAPGGSGAPTGQGQRPPMPPAKGDTLADSAIAKFAFEVYPAALTDEAKTALIGWDIKTTKNKDGSATVAMVPHNPEDPTSSYTVKADQKLYFVEMSAADDHGDTDEDSNLKDDYGILTDTSGIVQ